MSKSRMTLVAVVTAFATMLVGGVGTAAAQNATTKASQVVEMTGTAKNGKKFSGTYTIKRFTTSGGKVYAVGQLKGRLKGRNVKRSGVRIPASVVRQAGASASQLPNPTQGACQILNLVLEPIELNLLGLRIATSRIELLIEAQPGPGNLLGNLLCAITGILDPGANSPVNVLRQVLNALLALLPRTA